MSGTHADIAYIQNFESLFESNATIQFSLISVSNSLTLGKI